MTAICKTKLIHGTNLAPLLDYGSNLEKTSWMDNALEDTLDYAANPLKTLIDLGDGEKELLVSGIQCQPETALLDFALVRERYREVHGPERTYRYGYFDRRTGETRAARREPVTAIHLIQSFSEKGLDPRTVHQVGMDLCERLGVMAVVDTHMNTGHLHNHIVVNAYLPDRGEKFVMEKETILRIRELSDQLQQEYGIPLALSAPREQLRHSRGRGTYGEWKAKGQGLSWKEEMKDEMEAARSVSDSREDFITIMEDYGYTIAKQGERSITWWNKGHTRKIRDCTLGDAYGLDAMFPGDSPGPGHAARQAAPPRKRNALLSVARYGWDGRRRSDLELLVRKAIALIRHAGSRYYHAYAPSEHIIAGKLELMGQALEAVTRMGIGTQESLKQRLEGTGARLSHVKSSLEKLESQKQFYDTVSSLAAQLRSTQYTINSIRYWPDGKRPDLMPEDYSAADIRKAKASLCPMSGLQKRELYLKLRAHPEVLLAGNGFSETSAMDAEEAFAYFKGDLAERPACLRDRTQATMEQVYQKRNARLRTTLDKPIRKSQREHLERLLHSHGLSASMDALTQFDAVNIENCLGENPFSNPPIGQQEQDHLARRLQEASLKTNRDIRYILPGEYDAILGYLDGASRRKPAILKPSPPVSGIDAEKLQAFMDARGISCSIPVSELCKVDYGRMYGYVLGRGQIPDCAAPAPPMDKAASFHQGISKDGITPKKQLLLTQLRNQTNGLLELGIDPSNLDPVEAKIAAFRENYAALESQRKSLNEEYKGLIKLNQQISFARSPSFLFGPLFHEKVHEAPEVAERDMVDEKNNRNMEASKKPIFDNEPDL